MRTPASISSGLPSQNGENRHRAKEF